MLQGSFWCCIRSWCVLCLTSLRLQRCTKHSWSHIIVWPSSCPPRSGAQHPTQTLLSPRCAALRAADAFAWPSAFIWHCARSLFPRVPSGSPPSRGHEAPMLWSCLLFPVCQQLPCTGEAFWVVGYHLFKFWISYSSRPAQRQTVLRVAQIHYKTIVDSGSELKIFQLFSVQNWEATLTLMSEVILGMH